MTGRPAAKTRSRRKDSTLSVLLTGATGFVGCHTARALHARGHKLKLLVRDPAKMKRVLAPFGLDGLPHVKGDIADPRAVARALKDCDALVHAAAVVNVHASDAATTIRTNRLGTELVIGGAVERGIARIVQVSSSSALFDPGLDEVDEDTPLAAQATGYGRSKIESDLYVRGLQAGGAPIYTTYPGTVMGPDDPGLSEGMLGLRTMLKQACVITSSGIQVVDARDLAEAHVRLLERGGPAARYTLGGHYLPWAEFTDLLEGVAGTRLRRVHAPARLLQALGRLGDVAHRFVPFELPLSVEAIGYATEWTPSNDARVRRELGLEYRPLEDTLRDSIAWLKSARHL